MNINFTFSKEAQDLGIKIKTAQISGIQNFSINKVFEEYKQAELNKLKEIFNGKSYKENPILEGFRDLHMKVGRSNRDYVASPEMLYRNFVEKDRFPKINTLVDIYNLVSLKSQLALGAHDMRGIHGDVSLKLTNGNEMFLPLGKQAMYKVFPGEYGYIDDEENIICRLEVLQVEPTKVTTESKDIFLIVQGNEKTSDEYVEENAKIACELITKFCGGEFMFLN